MSARLRHRGPDDEGFVARSLDGAFVSFRGEDTVDALRDLPHWKSACHLVLDGDVPPPAIDSRSQLCGASADGLR